MPSSLVGEKVLEKEIRLGRSENPKNLSPRDFTFTSCVPQRNEGLILGQTAREIFMEEVVYTAFFLNSSPRRPLSPIPRESISRAVQLSGRAHPKAHASM